MFLVQDIYSTWSENTVPLVVLSRQIFYTFQQLNNFFSASFEDWAFWQAYSKKEKKVKNVCVKAYWLPSGQDAAKALLESYSEILKALQSFERDVTKKSAARCEPRGLINSLKKNWNCISHSVLVVFTATLFRDHPKLYALKWRRHRCGNLSVRFRNRFNFRNAKLGKYVFQKNWNSGKQSPP